MSKLQPLAKTVVWLKTQPEYDEYMQMTKDIGWGANASNNWTQFKKDTCVVVCSLLAYQKRSFYIKIGFSILTLPELKAKFGIGTPAYQTGMALLKPKTQPTNWVPHFTKDGHQLSQDKIKLASGKEYTLAELQAELNLLSSISKAHKKFFPSAK